MYEIEFKIAGIKLKCKVKATAKAEAIEKVKKSFTVTNIKTNDKAWEAIENLIDGMLKPVR